MFNATLRGKEVPGKGQAMFLSMIALGLATTGPSTVPQMLCNCDFAFASEIREDPDRHTSVTKSMLCALRLNPIHDLVSVNIHYNVKTMNIENTI